MKFRQFVLVFGLLGLVACSTREIVEENRGATEQRLITYSIEDLISSLPEQDFSSLAGRQVFLQSHFIVADERLAYADSLMKSHLQQRFGINFVDEEQADVHIDVYYQSMSTDTDSFGLSVPLVNPSNAAQHSEIPLLALEMYHGITECRYFIHDLKSGSMLKGELQRARVRTDNVSTPFFSFPWSHL